MSDGISERALQRIADLEATVQRLSANSDRHNSTLQAQTETLGNLERRTSTYGMRLGAIEDALGINPVDPDDWHVAHKINELWAKFVVADDKAERALGGAQEMHNLLLQLQKRVRAISFKVGVPVVETDAPSYGERLKADLERSPIAAPTSTEADGGAYNRSVFTIADANGRSVSPPSHEYWQERFRIMRQDHDAQMQVLREANEGLGRENMELREKIIRLESELCSLDEKRQEDF